MKKFLAAVPSLKSRRRKSRRSPTPALGLAIHQSIEHCETRCLLSGTGDPSGDGDDENEEDPFADAEQQLSDAVSGHGTAYEGAENALQAAQQASSQAYQDKLTTAKGTLESAITAATS